MSVLSADGLHRLGVVVRDYRASIEEFSRFFGIRQWEIQHIDGRHLSRATLREKPVDHSYITAVGASNGVSLELVQPVSGDSVFAEFLGHRGEGMHHLCTNVCSATEFAHIREELSKSGIGIVQSGVVDECLEYYLLDTRDMLAGPLIQVICRRDNSVSAQPKPDELVHFDDEVTKWNKLPIDKIYHACIVTKGRRDQVRDSLRQVLGIEEWFNFANESGVSAMNTTLYGEPCKIAFNLALGRRNTLCLEVVEEVYGRSLYTEFLEKNGEGLQHIMTTVCSEETLTGLQDWLNSQKMPLIMGGSAGSGDFCYYGYIDTRSRLAGITIEVLCPAGPDWLQGRTEAAEILMGPDVFDPPTPA